MSSAMSLERPDHPLQANESEAFASATLKRGRSPGTLERCGRRPRSAMLQVSCTLTSRQPALSCIPLAAESVRMTTIPTTSAGPGVRSAELFARGRRVLVDGVSSPSRGPLNFKPHPIFMARGVGAEIFDADGAAYV